MSYVISNLVLLNGHQPERFFYILHSGRFTINLTLDSIKGIQWTVVSIVIRTYIDLYVDTRDPLRWRLNKYGDFVIHVYHISLNEIFEIFGILYLKLYFPHLRKKCIKIQSYLSHVTEKRCNGRKKRIVYFYVEFLTLLKYICHQIVFGNDSWMIQLIQKAHAAD